MEAQKNMFVKDEEFSKVSLATLGKGAAVELFERELQNVLVNIDDPNTPTKEKREIVLKVTIVPSEARDFGTVSIECKAKLASVSPASTAMLFQRDGRKHVAFEPKGKQGNLFDAPKITPINKDQ
jgi:hypothetical protein